MLRFLYAKLKSMFESAEKSEDDLAIIEDTEELVTHNHTFKFMKLADSDTGGSDVALDAESGKLMKQDIDNKLLYLDGVSDEDGLINFTLPEVDGYESSIVSVMCQYNNVWLPAIGYYIPNNVEGTLGIYTGSFFSYGNSHPAITQGAIEPNMTYRIWYTLIRRK